MMYKVEYLPAALNDMSEIVRYIRDELANKNAAIRLSERFIEATERLCNFPYANPVYVSIKPLKEEYRKIVVDNYLIFYYVRESTKTVVISRVIYAKSNYINRME